MLRRGLALSVVLALLAVTIGCGDDDEKAGADKKKASASEKTAVPDSVMEFVLNVEGCLPAVNSGGYGGVLNSGDFQALGQRIEQRPGAVRAFAAPDSNTDVFVFTSRKRAQEADSELAPYREAGGKTEVLGLVLLAHRKRVTGTAMDCLETARKAAGPSLPDPPPAQPKLTAADQRAVLSAYRVSEYCSDVTNDLPTTVFPSAAAAEQAVDGLVEPLQKAPSANVKMPPDGQRIESVSEIAQNLSATLKRSPCLGAPVRTRLEQALP